MYITSLFEKRCSQMEPDKIVTAFCETLNNSLEESLVYISDDCVYQNMPFPAVIGPQGVLETLQGFFEITGQVRIKTNADYHRVRLNQVSCKCSREHMTNSCFSFILRAA